LQDFAIVLGHWCLVIGLLASAWAMCAALLGVANKGRGLQRSAEHGIHAATAMTIIATLCLWVSFLTNDFRVDYVYHYSSMSQAVQYKIGALWGGQAGSLLLWGLMLTVMSSIMIWTNRRKNRALMPWATVIIALTTTFFMIMLNFLESAQPFVTGPMRPDGVGLNPQLKNYWMMIHPPTLYLGWSPGARATSGSAPPAAGRSSPGSPWAPESCSAPTGPTSSWAGAATGPGTR